MTCVTGTIYRVLILLQPTKGKTISTAIHTICMSASTIAKLVS